MLRIIVAVNLVVFSLAPGLQAQIGGGASGGIYIDPEGVLRELSKSRPTKVEKSAPIDEALADHSDSRHVSLKRLDQALSSALAAGTPIPEEIEFLAGLVRIDWVQLDPNAQDIILIGPAEGWQIREGRPIGRTTKRPVLHLEDLAHALRCVLQGTGAARCSIDPSRAGLAALSNLEFPSDINSKTAEAFREDVEERYGMQTVSTGGVPDGSRFALVMIEADYRMKRMALGREKVKGVPSHLDTLSELTRKNAHRGSLARWWFTPAYNSVIVDESQTMFRFVGQGVKLLNEEVLFDETGQRSGLGQSNADWDKFSNAFSEKFPELETRYPVFADLHNLFDLMMVAGLIRQQRVADWLDGSALMDSSRYSPPTSVHPTKAEPVVTVRVHKGRPNGQAMQLLTIAYGGVEMNPMSVLAASMPETDSSEPEIAAKVESTTAVSAAPEKSESPFAKEVNEKAWWTDTIAKPMTKRAPEELVLPPGQRRDKLSQE